MNEKSPFSDNIEEVIGFLSEQDAQSRKRRSNLKTTQAVETIEKISRENGLNEVQLISLLDLSYSGKYADSVATRLVKSLIPSGKVPSLAVVKAVSWICTNKLSINQQALLLRWIIVIYKLIDNASSLHALYGILFLFLESDILCPHVCLLLSYLTTKDDVKHFRIKKLLSLQNRVGAQPHLTGLLAVYKIYCPNLVAMTNSSKKAWFKQRDKAWMDMITKVQTKQLSLVPVNRFFLEARGQQMAPKRRRVGGASIPSPQSSTSGITEEATSVSIQQLGSFEDLLKHFDNVELPSQIASVLESPFLQHIVSCNPSDVTSQRLNLWLSHTLTEAFLVNDADGSDPTHIRLLQMLVQLAEFLQESVPTVEAWLVRYLFSWNGVHYRPLILKMTTQLGLHPFTKLHDLVLEPLRKLFFSSSVYFKCQVMYCFTELLRNLVSVELSRYNAYQQSGGAPSRSSTSIFVDEEAPSFDPQSTLYEFVKYVDKICVIALQAEEDHALLQHHVLNFYELVSVLHTRYQVPFVVIPSSAVIYRFLFASNSMACSRLCQIIVKASGDKILLNIKLWSPGPNIGRTGEELRHFKGLFLQELIPVTQKQPQRISSSVPDGFDNIQLFNQFILDTCNSLWRNKAFLDRTSTSCFSIPTWVTEHLSVHHINEAFAIYSHVALVGLAWKFLKETQPEDVALNPRLIKGNVKQVYLEYLRRQGLDGISTFIETFIRHRT